MRKFLGSLSVMLLAAAAWAQTGVSVPEGTPLKVKLAKPPSPHSAAKLEIRSRGKPPSRW